VTDGRGKGEASERPNVAGDRHVPFERYLLRVSWLKRMSPNCRGPAELASGSNK
jgi:hypothetical protein